MTTSTRKLHPLSVADIPVEMKGGDLDIKKGDKLWVLRNHSGRYGTEPYQVTAMSDIVRDGDRSYGILILVETHIDDYFDCLDNKDIIGVSKEDVVSKVNKIVGRIAENRKASKERTKAYVADNPSAAKVIKKIIDLSKM